AAGSAGVKSESKTKMAAKSDVRIGFGKKGKGNLTPTCVAVPRGLGVQCRRPGSKTQTGGTFAVASPFLRSASSERAEGANTNSAAGFFLSNNGCLRYTL